MRSNSYIARLDYVRGLEDKLSDTAAFLDRLAERIDVLNMRTRIEAAADCRAMAKKLRGEEHDGA